MRSFRKRITILFLTAAIGISALGTLPCHAEDTAAETEITATAAAKVFTIDDAIEYAKEHSAAFIAVKANEAYAKSSAGEARITQSKLKNNRMLTITDVSTVLVTSGYAYNAALAGYRIAQRNTIRSERSISSSVSNSFYSYLSIREKVRIAEKSLESARERSAAAKIRHDNGFISDNDYESFLIAELQTQNMLSQLQRSLEATMLSLKSVICYPIDDELVISGSFTRQPKENTSLAEAVEKAKSCVTTANIEDTFKTASEKKRIYHAFYTSNQPAWHSAEAEYAAAQNQYINDMNVVRTNLFDAWNSIQSAYEGLELCDRTLALKEKQAQAAKISFDMGTISADTYLDAVKDVDTAKNNVLDAELQAYLANESYRLLFDCTNTIFEEGN